MFIQWKTSDFDSIEEAIHQLNCLEKCCVNKNKAIINLLDENKKLRYERLMWKAEAIRKESRLRFMVCGDRDSQRCDRIAEALEERAADIKAAETSRHIHEYLDEQNDLLLEAK